MPANLTVTFLRLICPLEGDVGRIAPEKSEEITQVTRKLEERKRVGESYPIYENITQLRAFHDHSSWSSERIREVERKEGAENFLQPQTLFPFRSEARGKGRVKDGRPSSEAAGRGNKVSSVGTDDFENPVCIMGNFGVVANITSQNTPI